MGRLNPDKDGLFLAVTRAMDQSTGLVGRLGAWGARVQEWTGPGRGGRLSSSLAQSPGELEAAGFSQRPTRPPATPARSRRRRAAC
jgi:hypothetical protein